MVSDPEGDRAPTEPKFRVEDDTGEEGTGSATTGFVGVPADLPCRAEAPPRGVLVITVTRGESCSERKRVASLGSGNANLYYQDKLHIAEFLQTFSGEFYCDKGSHKKPPVQCADEPTGAWRRTASEH